MPTNEFPENVESVKGPSTHRDEHGIEKPTPHAVGKTDAEHPGYEVTDVNTRGIVVFLAGLMGFIVIFFILCYAMGKAINYGLLKQDGDEEAHSTLAGGSPAGVQHRGESLSSNPEMEQHESQQIVERFPTPRLDADDSNQSTADLHAREDLLLEHYTEVDPSEGAAGTIHIPVEKAMELIVQRGLPQAATSAVSVQTKLTGDEHPMPHAPLTNGFARTAYELDQMEERAQKMKIEKAEK